MRWPRLRIRLTIELGDPEPREDPAPTYADGWMDNAGTLSENVWHPRMVGFQREDSTELRPDEDRR